MYVRVTELRIHQECVAAFVEATRVYQTFTRNEPGNIRAELLLSVERPPIFMIHEAYRDEASFWQHTNAPYTSNWNAAVAGYFQEQPRVLHLTGVGRYPTPPSPARRPAVESAATWMAVDSSSKDRRVTPLPRLVVIAQTIEVASAVETAWHGGEADPCLVCGAYIMHGTQLRNVGRSVYRFRSGSHFPCELIRDEKILDVPMYTDKGAHKILLLLFALEENGGNDVRALYQDIAEPEILNLWRHDAYEPRPRALADLYQAPEFAWNTPERVHVLSHSAPIADRMSSDGWVGAAAARLQLVGFGQSVGARFHTASDDRRNDWLTVVQVSIEKPA